MEGEEEEGGRLASKHPGTVAGAAFSVLLGENKSIKGTRGSIITEWGDRRQLPAGLETL